MVQGYKLFGEFQTGTGIVMTMEKQMLMRIFLLSAFLFYVNDFLFIALDGSSDIYLADYACRLLVLALCFFWRPARTVWQEESGLPSTFVVAVVCAIALPVLGRLSFHYIEVPFYEATKLGGLFEFPYLENQVYYWFDLTFGLALVALSEELVFRKYALKWLEAAGCSVIQVLIISALFFSLMHWGSGVGRLIYTFISGLLYMAVYMKVRRLWPVIIAHWLQNFAAFGPYEL